MDRTGIPLATQLQTIASNIRRHTEERDEAWAQIDESQREYLALTGWVACGYNQYTHANHPGIHELDAAYSIELKKVDLYGMAAYGAWA